MTSIIKRRNGEMPDPFTSLVDTVMKNSLSRYFDDSSWGFDGNIHSTRVPVNIRETGKSYEMEIVAPGLRKEDFHVDLDNGMLNVSFEKKEEQKEEDKNSGYLRNEFKMQSFSRSFRLDETVDENNIQARYADGILHLHLPKKEGAQKITRNIEIS